MDTTHREMDVQQDVTWFQHHRRLDFVIRIALVLLVVCAVSPTDAESPLDADLVVSPTSLVMGIGGVVRIESTGNVIFTDNTTVTMDEVELATHLISTRIIEMTIPGRKFWYGPKRLLVHNGNNTSYVIDGQFQLEEFRPFGTHITLFDFEDAPTIQDQYIAGNASLHSLKTTQAEVRHEPSHGSSFSLKELIITGQDGSTRWWITRPTTASPGKGAYIPEAVGMNRLVYDVKAPAGYNALEHNIGTYHSDPDAFPDGYFSNQETHNWHFYDFHYLNNPGTWKTHYDSFFYYSQRQSGGCCQGVGRQGESPTEPVAHRRGEISDDHTIIWQRGGKTFTVAPFDVLTRFYVDHSDRSNFGGQYIWFDNIGFATINDYFEKSPAWGIRDAQTNAIVEFPFAVTNTKAAQRNFYVISVSVSTASRSYSTFSAPEGVYEDTNHNGRYDAGEPRLAGTPQNYLTLDRPFQPTETRHFVLRMQALSGPGELRTGFVHFVEADINEAEAVYRMGTRYANIDSIPKKADGAYRSFTFHVNTPRTLPSTTVSTPQNVAAIRQGTDIWVVWDEGPEALAGSLAWYELEQGDSPSTLQYYRTVTAASPGYIDRKVNGDAYYRVRAVSTRGTHSAWSAVVSHQDPSDTPLQPPTNLMLIR